MAGNGEIENYLICSENYGKSVIIFFKDWMYLIVFIAATVIDDSLFMAVAFFGTNLIYSYFVELSARKKYALASEKLNNARIMREHIKTGNIKNGR